MRYPRKRRPRRTHRWFGYVLELGTDSEPTVCARLKPVGHKGPEVYAEFDQKHFAGALVGSYFNLYVHRRGLKHHSVIRLWTPPPLTAERLLAAQAWAHEHASWLSDRVES